MVKVTVGSINLFHSFNSDKTQTTIHFTENTTFNKGNSCYRICDGTPMSCYYELKVENYDTMSAYVLH